MIRRVNLFKHVRRYQWLLAGLIMVMALFVLTKPPVPADLNYRYQLDVSIRHYPLVPVAAGLVEWSTERVREVYRWNLTAETVGQVLPKDKAGTEAAVLPATVFIFLGIFACILIWFVPRYRWQGVGLVIFVIAGSHLGAHPQAYATLMAAPSTLIPDAAVTLVTHAEPGHTLGVEREAATGLKDMADRYFEHYVTFTEHRMGSAGKLFAGPKRLWFGITGLAYVVPFAVTLALLAALTTLVQTLFWVLCLAAPFGVALAWGDGRSGLRVWNHVIVPLLATAALLFVLGLVLPLLLYLATLVHAVENELGLLLVGSVFPIMLAVVVAVLIHRLRGGPYAGTGTPLLEGHPLRGALPRPTRDDVRAFLPHRRRARERHLGNLRTREHDRR